MVPALAAPSASDKTFVANTAQAGMTEVKLAEIAEKNGTNQSVKDFAKQMITDHTKANESLKQLATGKGMTVPDKLDAKHESLVHKFEGLKGRNFDVVYADQMMSDHKGVIASLKKESKSSDADLKQWAEKTLPTIEGHLKMAQDMDKKVDSAK